MSARILLVSCLIPRALSQVKDRIETMTKDLHKAKGEFYRLAKRYQDAHSQTTGKDARWFQSYLATEIREGIKLKLRDASFDMESDAFILPAAEWLQDQPDFKKQAVEFMGEKDAVGIEELQARSFCINMMLGQVVDRASRLAEAAYDKVMKDAFNKIGHCFCMSGQAFFTELKTFIESDEGVMDQEDVLFDFIDKENFKLMYVGCVL
ncbi:unnamed protein product, partial [Effrenium voratum]